MGVLTVFSADVWVVIFLALVLKRLLHRRAQLTRALAQLARDVRQLAGPEDDQHDDGDDDQLWCAH